jgi:hypothetical protein
LTALAEAVEKACQLGLPDASDRFWSFLRGYMEYLGRISVFSVPGSEQVADSAYPRELLGAIFGQDIHGLHPVLLNMRTPEEATSHLGELQGLIESITAHLNLRSLRQRLRVG